MVIKAADEFHEKTIRPNQLWRTDFTYLKAIGWSWFYLSTILDDYRRHVIAWRLCATMKASDATATLEDALVASGCNQATVAHRPRLLSDNGSSYISEELADWLSDEDMDHVRGAPRHPQTQGKIDRWHQTLKNRILLENYYLPGALEQSHRRLHRPLQPLPLPRETGQPGARRRLSRQGRSHPENTKGDQSQNHREAPLAALPERGIN